MKEIAAVVALVLQNIVPGTTKSGARTRPSTRSTTRFAAKAHARVEELLESFPVYPEIDLPFLLESFGLV